MACASRELVQPFTLESFRELQLSLNSYTDVVADLLTKAGGQVKLAGAVLESDLALIKRIPLSLGLSDESVTEQIEWEARQQLISDRDDYVLDFQRLPRNTKEGNPQYLMVLIRKMVVRQLKKIFADLGLRLVDIDLDIFSLVRVLANNGVPSDGPTCLIDIQYDSLTFIIVQDREFYLAQRVRFKGGREEVDGICDRLLKELKRLVFGHNLGTEVSVFKNIYLTGSDLAAGVKEKLDMSELSGTSLLRPFEHLSLRLDGESCSPELFSAAVGMALKQNSLLHS